MSLPALLIIVLQLLVILVLYCDMILLNIYRENAMNRSINLTAVCWPQ